MIFGGIITLIIESIKSDVAKFVFVMIIFSVSVTLMSKLCTIKFNLYKGKQIISVRLGNKETTVLYEGQLIKCAIALIIKDINLINYMIQRGYINPDNDDD